MGDYIRALRVQNGLTQAELAEQLHLTDKAVSKWDRNLSYPDISLMPKLADVLGVTVSDLICEMDDGGSPSRLLQVIQMSNDIRSPVHVILGCSELVDRFSDDPQKRKRYLGGIKPILVDRLFAKITVQFLMDLQLIFPICIYFLCLFRSKPHHRFPFLPSVF